MRKFASTVVLLASTVFAAVGSATADHWDDQECEEVSPETQAFYQEVATDKQPDARLSHGQIVHSPKPYQGREIYYVSFAVDGGKEIATWAQTGPDPTQAMQVAVRASYADELSVLGTAGSPDVAQISWPGASESQECVREALEASG